MFYDNGIAQALHDLALLKEAATVMMPALTPDQRAKMQTMTGFGEASSVAPELRRQNMWLNNRLQQLYEQNYPQEALQAPETLGAKRLRRIAPALQRGTQRVRTALGQRPIQMINQTLPAAAPVAEAGTQRALPYVRRALKAVRL